MPEWKLKRMVVPEGGIVEDSQAKLMASSNRVVHIEVVRGGSEGDFLEVWYLDKEKK